MTSTAGKSATRITSTNTVEDVKQKPSEYRQFLANSRVVNPGKNKGSTIVAVKDPGLQCSVSPNEPVFQALPEQIIFKGYKPFETYEARLSFQNKDKVARTVSVAPCESTIFSIGTTGKAQKAAAGMKADFVVKFTPTSTDDFQYDIVVDTERETFVVPLRTIGARGVLDLPDQVTFSAAAVKLASVKPLNVRNVGTRRAQFTLSTDREPLFTVSPRVGSLEPDASMQINVSFVPDRVGTFEGTLKVEYDTGEVVYSKISGASEEVNVFLEGDSLELDPTYTSLSSTKRIKLHNASDSVLVYNWRSLATAAEDEAAMSDTDPSDLQHASKRETEAARKQLENARLAFHSDFFQISPLEGKLWPKGTTEATVTFAPNNESVFAAVAYLDVQGRNDRLPLQLRGVGLGPKLAFSSETIEVGTLAVRADYQYEVTVTNVGDIEAEYQLAPYTTPQQAYVTFRPSSGVLRSGQSETLLVSFAPRSLGDMLIPFDWNLRGSTVPRTLRLHANVIGPTVGANVPSLDYGLVSYGFASMCTLRLSNTSDIPLGYRLRVPARDDAASESDEFVIEPAAGEIAPYDVQDFKVHLTPKTVGSFDGVSLLVDVECVGQAVLAIPVNADARVPAISTASSVLDFGEVFLDTLYTRSIVLQNDTDLLAAYAQLEPASDEATAKAAFRLDPPEGQIERYCNKSIKVNFTPKRPGPISTALQLQIAGSDRPPLEVALNAVAKGPAISLGTKELNFGKIPVLTKVVKALRLTNESPVPAPFRVVGPQGADACFSAEVERGVVPPNQSISLKITALVNDTVSFSSRLSIEVPEGNDLVVTLRAYGEGNCIVPSEDLTKVDFGSRPTNAACVREFTLTNRGRRGQVLTWTSEKVKKNRKLMNNEKEAEVFFSITPERLELKPGASATFTVRGQSARPQAVVEKFVCTGVAEIVSVVLFDTDVVCNFANPLLEFPPSLIFTWNYDHGVPLVPQSAPLVLRNVSAFALSFVLRPHSPFSITPKLEHSLQPGESVQLEAHFVPNGLRHEQLSGKTQSHVSIVYRDHPQKDVIQLIGVLNFPNLTFQPGSIDFGCIQNSTERRVPVLMKNDGIIPVEYSWSFLSEDDENDAAELAASVFDILPIRGRLGPGQSERAEVVFYARHDRKIHATACCSVVGGPQYEFPLYAESSSIQQYRLDRRILDFSIVPYDASVSQTITLSNTGKSALRYAVDTRRSGGRVQVQPAQGQVVAGASQVLTVTLTAGVPEKVEAQFEVQIDHFATELVTCLADAVFAHVTCTLPRIKDEPFAQLVAKARKGDKKGSLKDYAMEWMDGTRSFYAGSIAPSDTGSSVVGRGVSLQVQKWEEEAERLLIHQHMAARALWQEENARYLEDRRRRKEEEEARRQEELRRRQSIDRRREEEEAARRAEIQRRDDEERAKAQQTADELVRAASASEFRLPGQVLSRPSSGAKPSSPPKALLPVEAVHRVSMPPPPAIPAILLSSDGTQTLQKANTLPALHMADEGPVLPSPKPGSARGGDQTLPPQQQPADAVAQADGPDSQASDVPVSAGRTVEFVEPKESSAHAQPSVPPSPLARMPEPKQLVLGQFLCDFGRIVKGSAKRRSFRITNSGYLPISPDYSPLAKLLKGSMFSVEHDKVKTLAGFPRHDSVQFKFTCQGTQTGLHELTLPIALKDGPLYRVVLRANVVMPSVELSTEKLDFGRVTLGQCKIMAVQLYNDTLVPCEWTTGSNITKPKDAAAFDVSPAAGVLEPGQRINIELKFTPSEARKWALTVPVKLNKNPQSRNIVCKGEGVDYQLTFNPGEAKLGPVLPFVQDDAVLVSIRNGGDFPVEIFSLDFDKRYHEEEQLLRALPGYVGNTLLLPPRPPGKPVAQHLAQVAPVSPAAADVKPPAAEQAPASTVAASPSTPLPIPPPPAAAGTAAAASAAALPVPVAPTSSTSMPDASAPSGASDASKPVDIVDEPNKVIVFYGPAFGGKTTQAKLLASKKGFPLIDIDELIKAGVASNDAASRSGGVADSTASAAGGIGLSSASTLAPEASQNGGGPAAPLSARLSKSAAGTESSNAAAASSFSSAAAGAAAGTVSENYVVELLTQRLGQLDCAKGAVLDSLDSKLLPTPTAVASCVAQALHNVGRAAVLVVLHAEASVIRDRKQKAFAAPEAKVDAELKELASLPEEQYDRMTVAEQEAYDASRRALKQRKKEAQEARRKQVSDYAAILTAQRAREREAAEKEAAKNKPAGKPTTTAAGGAAAGKQQAAQQLQQPSQPLARPKSAEKQLSSSSLAGSSPAPAGGPPPVKILPEDVVVLSEDQFLAQQAEQLVAQFEAGAAAVIAAFEDNKPPPPAVVDDPKKKPPVKKAPTPSKTAGRPDLATAAAKPGGRRPSLLPPGSEEPQVTNENKKPKFVFNVQDGGRDASSIVSAVSAHIFGPEPEPAAVVATSNNNADGDVVELPVLPPRLFDMIQRPAVRDITPPETNFSIQTPTSSIAGYKERLEAEQRERAEREARELERLQQLERLERERLGTPPAKDGKAAKGKVAADASSRRAAPKQPPTLSQAAAATAAGPSVSVETAAAAGGAAAGNGEAAGGEAAASGAVWGSTGVKKGECLPETRWVIPAQTTISIVIVFSGAKGEYSKKLRFGVIGTSREFVLPVSAVACFPQIERDVMNLFADKKKFRKVSNTPASALAALMPPPETAAPGKEKSTKKDPKAAAAEKAAQEEKERLERERLEKEQQEKERLEKEKLEKARLAAEKEAAAEHGTVSKSKMKTMSLLASTKKPKASEGPSVTRKQFIVSTRVYEFGPLLFGKPRDGWQQHDPKQPHPNAERFRFTNVGTMPAECEFSFLKDNAQTTFLLSPTSLKLAAGESGEVAVWAFPKAAGLFDDSLVCLVKDNPEPLLVNLTAAGTKPFLEIDKPNLEFGRLLNNTSDTLKMQLTNKSLLPLSWKLVGLETLNEFLFSPVTGAIDALKAESISVTFEAKVAAAVKKAAKVEVRDSDGNLLQTVPINVAGECYTVQVELQYPAAAAASKGAAAAAAAAASSSSSVLNFGLVRVADETKQVLNLKNKGKYPLNFKFAAASKAYTVSPPDGPLPTGDKLVPVTIGYKCAGEVDLKEVEDLHLLLSDAASGQLVQKLPVRVSLRAVYSKYSFAPERGINFGPMQIGQKVQRSFTISNPGEFEFRFTLSDLSARLRGELSGEHLASGSMVMGADKPGTAGNSKGGPAAAKPAGQPAAAAAAAKKPGDSKLLVRDFAVAPSFGAIAPGQSQKITVDYSADSGAPSLETIGIDISDRDPNDHPAGIPYELAGESCIPSIATGDYGSIFELQTVIARLGVAKTNANVFAIQEKVFQFYPIILGGKMEERFKITNTSKVPTTVNFSVSLKKGAPKDEQLAFEVRPARLSIPPQEFAFVTVTFNPATVRAYAALFEAAVDKGSNPKTSLLSFELRGEATLPLVSVQQPSTRNKFGNPLLAFRRLLVGRSQTLPIVVSNDGILPATVRWEMAPSAVFSFPALEEKGRTIQPGQTHTYEMRFTPNEPKAFSHELRVKLQDNEFDNSVIVCQGDGFVKDITLEQLPSDDYDGLRFGDIAVGSSKTLSFSLHNHSSSAVRFESKAHPDFFFVPSVGQIGAASAKKIAVTFRSSEPRSYKELDLGLRLQKIQLLDETFLPAVLWDNTAAAACALDPTLTQTRGMAEPGFRVLEDLPNVELKVVASSDYARYECATPVIQFKSTPMFQTRVFTLPFKNISNATIECAWSITDEEGLVLAKGETPYAVSPAVSVVPPQQTVQVAVSFSPLEVEELRHRLVGKVANLHPSQRQPSIEIHGSSSRPLCHFDLADNDYIESRRSPELRGPDGRLGALNPLTRVLEVHSIGVKQKVTTKLVVLNPTNITYDFEWIEDGPAKDPAAKELAQFSCHTTKGTLLGGKKFEMVFDYVAFEPGLQESFWRFRIGAHSVEVPFLVVGHCHEPEVFVDRSHLNFEALLVNHTKQEVIQLVNKESLPFTYKIDKSKLGNGIDVQPLAGTLPPDSHTPLTVFFTPNQERKFTFHVPIVVARKMHAISVNIKGEGHVNHELVELEGADGAFSSVSPDEAAGQHRIDFGNVQINDSRQRTVNIRNEGEFAFDVTLKTKGSPYVTLESEVVTVPKGESKAVKLLFKPTKVSSLGTDTKLILQVTNGHKYIVALAGEGKNPELNFSFTSHDFGPCFLLRPGQEPVKQLLRITNTSGGDIYSVDCSYKTTPQLEVVAHPVLLKPSDSVEVPFLFYPRAETTYTEIVPFEINNLSTVNVKVTGEGCKAVVELVNPAQRNVKFGSVKILQRTTTSVPIVNRSKRPVVLSFAQAAKRLQALAITLQPPGEVTLKPKESVPLQLAFEPTQRITAFNEELIVDVSGFVQSLCTVSGQGAGVEFQLAAELVSFGSVVLHGSSVQTIALRNVGDSAARFKWGTAQFGREFDIQPADGVLPAGEELTLRVTFAPTALSEDVRYPRVPCTVEGGATLFLTLCGTCIKSPEKDTLRFQTPVRQRQTKTVTLANTSVSVWDLKPVFSSEWWSTDPKPLRIVPGSSMPFDVHYDPTEMTGGNGRPAEHQGTLFFALPDGSSLLYKLVGQAMAPLPAAHVAKTLPAKATHQIVLTVKNWLKQPQRFRATIEPEKTDPAYLASFSLKGLDILDVPATGERQYKLNFTPYKEGAVNAKVTFTNESSKEYVFFTLAFTVTAMQAKVVELDTPVRRAVTTTVSVENPLETTANFTVSCSNTEDVTLGATTLTAAPKSEAKLEVTFLPLVVRETTARLTIASPQLGETVYELRLTSTPSGMEQPLVFAVALGKSQTLTFRFVNYAKVKNEYACRIDDSTDFTVDKSVSSPAATTRQGNELSVDVTYEPSSMADVSTLLRVTSPQGGEYVCVLQGKCLPPQPQGPLLVKASAAANVSIYNPFNKPCTFVCTVDNAALFSLKPTELSIPSKKSATVAVSFKPGGPNANAKLSVTCEDAPTPWITYLKGQN